MKLSNTMLISKDLLPSYNKAFTLAEVLITLTILGVVAAITIPSLINRQNEISARTKVKKAIATYEDVAAVVMADTESTVVTDLYTNPDTYFKSKESAKACSSNKCFTTQDGAYWTVGPTGAAMICDTDTNPKYCATIGVYASTDSLAGNAYEAYSGFTAPSGNGYKVTAKQFLTDYASK